MFETHHRIIACLILSAFVVFGGDLSSSHAQLSVDESIARMRFDPQLEVQIVASEPMVQDPVCVAWGADGAMYVAEMGDYPISKSGGRIKRLVDNDGDGLADAVTTFVDNVSYPTSVLPWKDGILVAAAPDILWFQDTNNDGVADVRQVLLTGFGTGNQQLRVNGLTWGLDNYVYGANGRSDGEVSVVDEHGKLSDSKLSIRSSDFRFRPRGQVELAGGFTQFGQSFDDYGQRFISWNTIHIRHVVMEQQYLANNPRAAVTATAQEISDGGSTPRVYPISSTTPRFNAEPPGFFNASCGLTIFRGDQLGREFRGNAFACEPLSNLVHRDILVPDGISFVAKRSTDELQREFLASTDPWFRPVNLATGPDGALYVVDFYRRWVEHPQFVADEKARNSVDFSEGKEYGRIYRVVPKGLTAKNKLTWAIDLRERSTNELIKLMGHENSWQRETAQRILIDRDLNDAELRAIAATVQADSSELAALHALGCLLGKNRLTSPLVLSALQSRHAHVRRFAVRLAEPFLSDVAIMDRLSKLSDDSDDAVRLQLACTVGLAERSHDVAIILAKLLHVDGGNVWMRQAVFTASRSLTLETIQHLATLSPSMDKFDVDQLVWLIEYARSGLTSKKGWEDQFAGDWCQGAWKNLVLLSLLRNEPDLVPHSRSRFSLQSILRECARDAVDDKRDRNSRLLAIGLLEYVAGPKELELLADMLAPEQPLDIQTWAATTLTQLPSANTSELLIRAMTRASPIVKRSILDSMISRKEFRINLADALILGDLSTSELDMIQRQSLVERLDAKLGQRLQDLFKSNSIGTRAEVVDHYLSQFQPSDDIEQGRQLYRKNCQSCHARDGEGHRVGPDLTAVAGRSPKDILVDILDPNRSVSEDNYSYSIITDDDRIITGLIAAQSSTSISIKQAGGAIVSILRADILELKRMNKSLMPEGFEDSMNPAELASLIAFLKKPLSE